MLNVFSALTLSYIAGSGTVTNASLVGRGLVRAVRRLVGGEYKQAGVEAAAALMSPALVSYASIAGLVLDVADAAGDLATGVLDFRRPGARELAG